MESQAAHTGVDFDRLTPWMDSQGLGRGAVRAVTALGGGTQNILLRFARGGHSYVLRRPPLNLRDNSNETMRREARVLKALATSDVPHPKLIAACGDESVIGAAFYLMEHVEGFNAREEMPPLHAGSKPVRRRMGFALVDGLAGLGRLDYRSLGLEDLGRPEGFLERQVGRWRAQLESYATFRGWNGAADLPGVDKVSYWLERHRPKSSLPGILHGDFQLANVLYRFDSGELAAIVDWELTTIGDPLLDLGWVLATWPDENAETKPVTPWEGFPNRSELIERYGQNTNRDISLMPWYSVLACFKLGILLEGTYARACAGKAPPAVGDYLHSRAIFLLDRAERWMT